MKIGMPKTGSQNLAAADKARKLDPLPGRAIDRPRPSLKEGNVRMLDVQMVWDVVTLSLERPRGARRRVAEKHDSVPATITEAIRRFENAFDVKLFDTEGEDSGAKLTPHGRALAQHGATFLQSFQLLRKLVQEAQNT